MQSVRCPGHPLIHRGYYSHLTEWNHSPAVEVGIGAWCDELEWKKSDEGHPLIANKYTRLLMLQRQGKDICDKKVRNKEE